MVSVGTVLRSSSRNHTPSFTTQHAPKANAHLISSEPPPTTPGIGLFPVARLLPCPGLPHQVPISEAIRPGEPRHATEVLPSKRNFYLHEVPSQCSAAPGGNVKPFSNNLAIASTAGCASAPLASITSSSPSMAKRVRISRTFIALACWSPFRIMTSAFHCLATAAIAEADRKWRPSGERTFTLRVKTGCDT